MCRRVFEIVNPTLWLVVAIAALLFGAPPVSVQAGRVSPPAPQGAKFDFLYASKSAAYPYLDFRIHDNGYLHTTINNNGIIGNIFGFDLPGERKQAPSFYHPRYSRIQHGYYAGLWVGGVVRGDTLVTVAMDVNWNYWEYRWPMEFWPDSYPFGAIEERSTNPLSPHYDQWAKAEQEFTAVYTDTAERQSWIPYNFYDSRSHKPMNIKVTQTSYSWTYKYARDFVLVDYIVNNLGADTIYDAWIGLYYVGCVHHRGEQPYAPSDDLAGYIYSVPHEYEECGEEAVRAAYIVDNDGWSWSFPWDFVNTTNAFAITPLRLPKGAYLNNFNWWDNRFTTYFNWGPRQASTSEYSLRRFSGGLGDPMSDRDKYYLMSRPEVDYSGYEAAVDYSAEGWLPPHEFGGRIARGHLPEFVTSFGPFTILPGKEAAFTVAMVIGEKVHYDRMAFRDTFDTLNPGPFLAQLDFEDLITNIRWANLVYDNPGIETDGDGDSGRWFMRYQPETGESLKVYCTGDGVPDFRGATPPPPPVIRVITEDGRIIVRWNGRATENYFDPLSFSRDFEGYRVYIARSERLQEAVLLASYDQENYNRHSWSTRFKRYVLEDLPYTLDSLRVLYGEDFEPLEYIYSNPLFIGDDAYYFVKVDHNTSDLMDPTGIHRLYPDALKDTSDVDEEGRMRYYEYEYVIENLLLTVPYYVSVTAFDFGHPPKSLDPLESLPTENMVKVMAVKQGPAILKDGELNVYCYPNPYRIDDTYAGRGFENRDDATSEERARGIYFANLPHKCTISILSLDGDLVRELEHDEPEGSGTASVHRWNMITRNTQAIVTGLYYWVVESEYGNQVGKLVILK